MIGVFVSSVHFVLTLNVPLHVFTTIHTHAVFGAGEVTLCNKGIGKCVIIVSFLSVIPVNMLFIRE